MVGPNELEVTASPETIWPLLTDTHVWPQFYPSISHVLLLHGHKTLQMGTAFETSFAGQDVFASVQEFELYTRIAWGGYPKVAGESKVELAKQAPDAFWLELDPKSS